MKVFANFPHELPADPEFRVVAVGVFDGLHCGHQKLLASALAVAAGQLSPAAVRRDLNLGLLFDDDELVQASAAG